jgi:hypothetical protein
MIRIVFFSFLWVLVFPFSVWANGKGAEASGKADSLPKTDSSPKKMEEIIETDPSIENPAPTNGLPNTDTDKKSVEETAKSDGLPKTDSEKIPAEAPKPSLK